MASLVKEIADDSNTNPVRQMSAVVCKNLIANRSNDARYQDIWIQLEPYFKNNMKEAILSSLASESS